MDTTESQVVETDTAKASELAKVIVASWGLKLGEANEVRVGKNEGKLFALGTWRGDNCVLSLIETRDDVPDAPKSSARYVADISVTLDEGTCRLTMGGGSPLEALASLSVAACAMELKLGDTVCWLMKGVVGGP